MPENKRIQVAILDLYEGVANQGMRCIREILNQYADSNNLDIHWDEFDVRLKNEVPGMEYDIYISSGGPGSPLESEGSEWEISISTGSIRWKNGIMIRPINKKNMYFLSAIRSNWPAGIIK